MKVTNRETQSVFFLVKGRYYKTKKQKDQQQSPGIAKHNLLRRIVMEKFVFLDLLQSPSRI